MTPRTAIVIGAGFGGLAPAIRLQSEGIATTLLEARDKPGGRAYVWREQGHVFDAGPTVITGPDALRELWALSGRDMAEDVALLPVSPFYRLLWPDGKSFDYVNDSDALEREIARFSPGDLDGYRRFHDYAEEVYREGHLKLETAPFLSWGRCCGRRRPWRGLCTELFHRHCRAVGGDPVPDRSVLRLRCTTRQSR